MANKISTLLSLLVLMQFLLFSGNLIHYQITVARLYAIVPVVNDYLSYHGEINEEIQSYVTNINHGQMTCIDSCIADSGQFLHYRIEVVLDPIFLLFGDNKARTIIVVQKVLVGY